MSRREAKYRKMARLRTAVSLISLLAMIGTLLPGTAKAGILGDILAAIRTNTARADDKEQQSNVQVMTLLKPAMNIDPSAAKGGGDVTIVDDSALLPSEGPSGTIADIEKPKNGTISIYIVRKGDTLSSIAELFKVSPNTIRWANDLPRGSQLKIGEKLVILPITGIRHTIKKGDTVASLAKKYDAEPSDIIEYNGLVDGELAIGEQIIIPDGEIAAPAPSKGKTATGGRGSVPVFSSANGYYIRPVGGIKTQGIHGYNGVDIAAPVGTPIVASAAGEVIVSRNEGWNGGYGKYIVIQHANGSQTLYSHNSQNIVSIGQSLVHGQVIGYVGSTGRSTGSHVHFEIRNGMRNPF